MNLRAREAVRRRDALIARSEAQRRQIAESAQSLKSAFHAVDRALGIARYMRAHPLLAGAAVAAAALVGRGRLLRRLAWALPIVSLGLRAGRALRKPRDAEGRLLAPLEIVPPKRL
jgi:hypothetical protein